MKRQEFLRTSRGFTLDQLTGKISEHKKKLIDLDQQKLLGKLKNVTEIRQIRQEIARLMTIRDELIVAQMEKKNA